MVYIEYSMVGPSRARVTMQMFKPENLTAEQKKDGVTLPEVPAPDFERGVPQLYINPDTLEMWYEYLPHPAPEKSREELLQDEVESLKAAMAQLMGEVQAIKGRQTSEAN